MRTRISEILKEEFPPKTRKANSGADLNSAKLLKNSREFIEKRKVLMKARNKNRRVKSFHPVIILFVITISSFFGAADIYGQPRRRSVKKSTSAAQVAKPLPELKLPDLNGAEWSLHQNRGRVVLINFWATWCAPCRAETPMLVNFSKEYKRRGLEIVGIALDDDGAGNVKNFVADYKVDYPILLPVPDSALSRIDPVPTTLLIDADGRLAKKYVGALSENILRTDIEKLIGRLMMKNETTKDAKNTKNTKKRNLTILHTNDLHGHLDSWQGWEGNLNGKTVGGLDRLAAQIEKFAARRKPTTSFYSTRATLSATR